MIKQQTDFRSRRVKLRPEDFALSDGREPSASDMVSPETWKSMVSLPDDVSLRTSDHHGSCLEELWQLWGEWNCLVGGLQRAVPNPSDSPIAHAASEATDYLQSAIFNALVGYYRLAFASLRGIVENMTIGLHLELAQDAGTFSTWLEGNELGLKWAADHVVKHPRVKSVESRLALATGDDLFHQHQRRVHQGGLVRRLFRVLSRYAHGAPNFNDGDMWESNGPVYVPKVFQHWAEIYFTTYALAVLEARLGQPQLGELPWGASHDAKGLFTRALRQIQPSSDAKRLLAAVPESVW